MSVTDVVELASVLARRYYGPKSGAIVYALLQYPRSTVAELVAPASAALLAHHRRMLSVSDVAAPPPPLSRDDVCRCLAGLLQAGVVLVVGVVPPGEVAAAAAGGAAAAAGLGARGGAGAGAGAAKRRRVGSAGTAPPPPTHRYSVDSTPLIQRLRHPFYVRLTQDQVGAPAATVLSALLARGRATASSLLTGVVAAGGVADVKEGEEALAALLASKYVRVVEVGYGARPAAGSGGGGGGSGGTAAWPGGGVGGGGTGGGSPGSSSGGGGGSGSGDSGPEPSATNDRTVWAADMGHMQRLLLEDLCAFVAFGRLGADASRLIRAAMHRTLRYPPSRDGSGSTPAVPIADVLAAVAETVPAQTALGLLTTMARPEHRYVELGSSAVGEAAGGGGSGPTIGRTVAVRHGAMVRAVQASTVEFYVKKRWGTAAYRIYRLLTSVGVGSLEQKDIGDAVLMPLAPARELLYRLLLDGLVRVTEVAKTTEYKSAAAYHLWSADGTAGVGRVLSASLKAATNYLLRVEVLERCLDRVRREVHDDDSATSAEVEALQRRIDALDVTLLRLDTEIMVLRDLGDDAGAL